MSKIIMSLHLPEPKVRKATAKAEQKHKDKRKYTRKVKHNKGPWDSPRAFAFTVPSLYPPVLPWRRRASLLPCR